MLGCATLILPGDYAARLGFGGCLNNSKGMKVLAGTSLVLALLQSVCTAVLTISGIRLAIGLTAFALAGSTFAPVRWFHQDAIRIPMLAVATIGAIVDLMVLAWMRHLRSQPGAQWRKRQKSRSERRSQRLQVALAVLTLILVGLEIWTHILIHRPQAHVAVYVSRMLKG